MKQADPSRRRWQWAHTLGFVAHPGNAWVLASRALRRMLGRELRVEKPGPTIHAAAVRGWLDAAAQTPAERFVFIDDHRRWVAAEHGRQVLHATDRRHAADQTIAQRCVAVSLPEEDGRVLYFLARELVSKSACEKVGRASRPSLGRSSKHGLRRDDGMTGGTPVPPDGNAHPCARRVIEMGTAFGVGTRYLAAGIADGGAVDDADGPATLWTIEADETRQRIACAQLGELDKFVQPLPGTVETQMPRIGAQAEAFDLVFIDALHTFDATWGYYELIRRYARGRTFCIFHDVNSSWAMARVWRRIVTHPATREAASWRRLGFCLVEGGPEAEEASA